MNERRANCPNCGAEIVFRWSGAIQTTCPACRSILVRHDINLETVGKVASVPPSTSGIQLGTEGRFKDKPFVVVGRIIYRYELGHWNEWHLRFSDDTSGWLSDAQAEYAVSRAVDRTIHADASMLGDTVRIGDKKFTLAAITDASYAGVEGELPFEYWDKREVRFLDLRGEGEAFATIDESETPRLLFVGEFETFEELRLKNLRDIAEAPESAAPRSKGLNCPSCGSGIELLTGDLAVNVACRACGSILDAKDPNFEVLQRHQEKMRGVKPAIPLGSKGMLKGKTWHVIGFQIRGITVDGTLYRWREFLLWNGEAGYRYLTEYEGHWNDVAVIKGMPTEVTSGPPQVYEYLGTHFRHFQHAKVTTEFVLGEFPWQVRVGDQVVNDDFVAPPLMLSRERTENEITWSVGTYTSPARIQEAFKLKDKLRAPSGVFANQPNPSAGRGGAYWRIFSALAASLVVLVAIRHATARNEQVFRESFVYDYRGGDTAAFVTPVFEVKGRTSNVELITETSLANDNAFFSMALLPENGGKGYEVGREVSNYFGVDGGESWREGSPRDRVIIPSVPAGSYYLRVEPEKDPLTAMRPFTYSITVRRDVPRWWPFLITLLLLTVPPLFAWMGERSFESKRWAESDYAPEETGTQTLGGMLQNLADDE